MGSMIIPSGRGYIDGIHDIIPSGRDYIDRIHDTISNQVELREGQFNFRRIEFICHDLLLYWSKKLI